MDKKYKRAGEDSVGMFIEIVGGDGGFMDVKEIVLTSQTKHKLFVNLHVLYLLVINADRKNIFCMDVNFQRFIIEEVGVSRAQLFKLMNVFVESKWLKKQEQRGYYKLTNIKTTQVEKITA